MIELIELMYRRGGAVVLPDGREASSEFAGARLLIADGYDPATPVQTRWPGSRHVSLSGTLGGWARLTIVADPTPRFAEYRPREYPDKPRTRRLGEGVVDSGATLKPAGGAQATPQMANPENGWSMTTDHQPLVMAEA